MARGENPRWRRGPRRPRADPARAIGHAAANTSPRRASITADHVLAAPGAGPSQAAEGQRRSGANATSGNRQAPGERAGGGDADPQAGERARPDAHGDPVERRPSRSPPRSSSSPTSGSSSWRGAGASRAADRRGPRERLGRRRPEPRWWPAWRYRRRGSSSRRWLCRRLAGSIARCPPGARPRRRARAARARRRAPARDSGRSPPAATRRRRSRLAEVVGQQVRVLVGEDPSRYRSRWETGTGAG